MYTKSIADHLTEEMKPLVGGTIESVKGKRFQVRGLDGKVYHAALQGDSEGNMAAEIEGVFPQFAGARYDSLTALKGFKIVAAECEIDEYDEYNVLPTLRLEPPADIAAQLSGESLYVQAFGGTTGGWVYVWAKGTKAPGCLYQR